MADPILIAPRTDDQREIGTWRHLVSKLLNALVHTALTSYSATSTIVGWVSFTIKIIEYVKIGKVVTVWFDLTGVSNATGASFTLPYASANTINLEFVFRSYDNSATSAIGIGILNAGASTVNLYSVYDGTGWTAANNKYARGQFSYLISE